jgi:flagellar biosynthetic protein FliQ
MSPGEVVEIFRGALWLIVVLVGVIITPSLLVGLVVSVFQAATQINEQTLSFLPRLVVTLLTLVVTGPWLLQIMVEYTDGIIHDIPGLVG